MQSDQLWNNIIFFYFDSLNLFFLARVEHHKMVLQNTT